MLDGNGLWASKLRLTLINYAVLTCCQLFPTLTIVVQGNVEQRWTHELQKTNACKRGRNLLHHLKKTGHNVLVLRVTQMPMQQVKDVLIVVLDWELTAVEFIKGSAFGLQQQAHHQG